MKSVEAQRPKAQAARVERSKLPAIESTLAQAVAEPPKAAPDSGFAVAKKRLVNTTGRHKPVALPLNAALPSISAGKLRGSANAIEAALRGPPRDSAQPGLLAFKGEVAQAQGVGARRPGGCEVAGAPDRGGTFRSGTWSYDSVAWRRSGGWSQSSCAQHRL